MVNSITHAIMITGFVFMMMVLIEYFNVLSRGIWQKGLRGSRWRQYILASFLGATPGCLGAFTAVSLYAHREITLGALVAAMIATSGDESFVMLSMVPEKALLVFTLLLCIGFVAGVCTDILFSKKAEDDSGCSHKFAIHDDEACHCFPWGQLRAQWLHCSPARGILASTLALFSFAVCTGHLGPASWNWIKITLVSVSTVALFIVSTVPDHFLEEHLWNHVAKRHVPKVFLWTFAALLLMHLLMNQLHLTGWMQKNQLVVLLIACLVGLIPESGPHLIFLTLFTENAIPFSVFLASSIVQDGHGMLPMLAESRTDFFKVKGINFVIGLLLGATGFLTGW